MIFIAYRRRANTHGIGGLLRLFYRDGIFYFLTLSTLAVTNIIFDHTAPSNGLQFMMVQIQVHFNSVITARMLIHLREWAKKDIQVNPYVLHGNAATSTAFGELEFSGTESKSSRKAPRVFIEVNRDYTISPGY
ncbi:hypothetical protein DFP72DRAFT_889138 [Ephemerocybe angulata]|uniref:Uncharacterized protein n=1 Tax=Ephemerocybe angulata TaxID=980116 RepID=A0A8H6I5Q7_9AGAR|nr:hypothetical protein DFP72DRAFT_889138 [Tulosesus angulatus]